MVRRMVREVSVSCLRKCFLRNLPVFGRADLIRIGCKLGSRSHSQKGKRISKESDMESGSLIVPTDLARSWGFGTFNGADRVTVLRKKRPSYHVDLHFTRVQSVS